MGRIPVVALAALLGSGLVLAQDSAPPLVAPGPPPNLFLLYTGDVIGYLDPCG